ncbi:unnamed protein product [Rangifer tarandus platyrhynchus]|uniref:Uncharacterized protein n=1 Tax=Rangifer tarandus platyrhynchus TaxID=3082113 RepID=A0AC59YRX9_RANTA
MPTGHSLHQLHPIRAWSGQRTQRTPYSAPGSQISAPLRPTTWASTVLWPISPHSYYCPWSGPIQVSTLTISWSKQWAALTCAFSQVSEHAAKGGASLAFSNTLPSRCGTFHLSALCRLRASSPPPGRRVFILRPTPPPWPVLPSAPHASVRPLGALSPPSVRPRSRASAPGAGRRWRVMTSYGPPARDWPQPPHQTPNGRARGRGGARGSHAPGRWAGRGHVTRGAPPPAL